MNPKNESVLQETDMFRLPFARTIVVKKPSLELRRRIAKLMKIMGVTAEKALEFLLRKAAGEDVNVVVIKLRCADGTPVAIDKVNEAVERVFFAINSAKGLLASRNSEEKRATLEDVVTEVLGVWTLTQKMTDQSLFSPEMVKAGNEALALVEDILKETQSWIERETAKGENIAGIKVRQERMAKFEKFREFLIRCEFTRPD